jgi:hypothetical protein
VSSQRAHHPRVFFVTFAYDRQDARPTSNWLVHDERLAICDLYVALWSEPGSEPIELTEDVFELTRANLIRAGAKIAARAGEIAPWMSADGGAASGSVLAETLANHPPPRVERMPPRAHQSLLLACSGLFEKAKGVKASVPFAPRRGRHRRRAHH